MGNFRINNNTLTIPDPSIQYDDLDFQGYQGNTAIYGEFETATLVWDALSESQCSELHQRIEGLNGQRVLWAIPSRNASGWRTVYVSSRYPTYSHRAALKRGVSVRLERISGNA